MSGKSLHSKERTSTKASLFLATATLLFTSLWLLLPGAQEEAEAHTRITTDITWSNEIRALLRTHCMRCHSPGGIGPDYVDLTTYGTDSAPGARAWATAIEEELMTGRMPPWQADARYDQYENSRALTPLERDMIVAWVQGGAPQGPKRNLPPPAEYSTEPWELGVPGVVVELPQVFVLAADQTTGIDRQTKTIELEKDAWVTGLEFRPDAPHSVARASAWVIDDHLEPESLEVEIQVPYDPFADDDAVEPTRLREMPVGRRFLGQWLHGDSPVLFPDGAGKRLRKGSKVELVVEYERSTTQKVGAEIRDRTRVGLFLNATEDEIEKVIEQASVTTAAAGTTAGGGKKKKSKKPRASEGAAVMTHRAALELAESTRLIGLNPNLPSNTQSVEIKAVYPDQRSLTLLYVPQYDARWPASLRFNRELDAPAGTRVEMLTTLAGEAVKQPDLIVDYLLDDHLVLPEIVLVQSQAESAAQSTGMMANVFGSDDSLDGSIKVPPSGTSPGTKAASTSSSADPNAAAHMDHSSLHGGQFFMASNMYHHVEGALPAPGIFRLYIYDDFKKALDPRNFAGSVVFETWNETTGDFSEKEFPLEPVPGTEYLEGKIKQELPLEFFASVWLAGKKSRYDFYFEQLSEEPAYVSTPGRLATAPVGGDHSHDRPPIQIPSDPKGIVIEMAKRAQQLEGQIDAGEWRTLYVPAFDSRDLAEVLQERLSGLSPRDIGASRRAISKIMQGAVELDRAGDLADPARARKAYERYLEGVTTLVAIFR